MRRARQRIRAFEDERDAPNAAMASVVCVFALFENGQAGPRWQDTGVEYNHLAARARLLADALNAQRLEADGHREQLGWYDQLDPETAVADAEAEAARLERHLDEQRNALEVAKADVKRLRLLTWARLYLPAYIASESVRNSGTAYRKAVAALAGTAARVTAVEAERSRAVTAVAEKRDEVDRHQQFDKTAVVARLGELDADIASATLEYEAFEAKAMILDGKLAPVVSSLLKATHERDDLQDKIDLARGYVAGLDDARDGAARYRIHQAAERDLGNGKPGRFITQNRGNLDRLERDVKKLEHRVRDIVRQDELQTDVRKLVVDGSNLCHAGPEMIGLFALRALRPHLVEGRNVQVIFDATITRVLGKDEQTLQSDLPDVEVHVADSRTNADKLILRLVDEPGAYVLSNDKYRDYPEMKDVVEAKRINVEIIGNRAIVDDLGIDLTFTRVR